MKRALAERAKQSAKLPHSSNGKIAPIQRKRLQASSKSKSDLTRNTQEGDSSSSQQQQQRPQKIPRRHSDVNSGSSGVAPIAASTSLSSSETQQQSQSPLSGQTASDLSTTGNPNHRSRSSTNPTQNSQSHDNDNPATVASSTSNSNKTNSAKGAGASSSLKRQRNTQMMSRDIDEEDDPENPNFAAFYLRHQNQALASEIKSCMYQLRRLGHERDYRRKQCQMACQALNSLQATWTQMEAALHQHQHDQQQTGPYQKQLIMQQNQQNQKLNKKTSLSAGAPMSTGAGTSVELIGSLFDSLASLATDHASYGNKDTDDDGDPDDDTTSTRPAQDDLDPAEKQKLDDLSSISRNVLQRANTLEQWIWSLLQKLVASDQTHQKQENVEKKKTKDKEKYNYVDHRAENRELTKDIAELRGRCRDNQTLIEELAKARDDIAASDRKVRRSIYRLAAGRVDIEQVIKDLEKSDEDGNLAAEAKMEALAQAAAVEAMTKSLAKPEKTMSQEGADNNENDKGHLSNIDKNLQEKIDHLDQVVANRDKLLEELKASLIEKEKRISDLSAKQLSEEDSKKLQEFDKTSKKLKAIKKELIEVKQKLEINKEKWAEAIGDKELALKSVEELSKKQLKRWSELLGDPESNLNVNEESVVGVGSGFVSTREHIQQAEQIVQLQHKLDQALENVRQADIVRQNLKEAIAMNESLQFKLDEVKGKYAALQAGRSSNSNSSRSQSDQNSTGSGSSTPKDKSSAYSTSSSGDKMDQSKFEKLYKEHRRMRKEVAALTASKDAAKIKLERTEKERDALVETNGRLLKQSAEKDETNAKSLSDILHLKNLTEQMGLEKINLEKQAKSAMQLALAARLATNAKDRVAEEVLKEKKVLEEKLQDAEKKIAELKKELISINDEFSEADSKISMLKSKLQKSLQRSNELAAECSKGQEEKLKLSDSLDAALRKVAEAESKVKELSLQTASSKADTVGSGGGNTTGSGFTVDQLNTQVSVLKGRLECPVCHYRDKDCIILRCRHMFCKHCVEENIQNRSRKCPSCGGKFSERDVEDVWL